MRALAVAALAVLLPCCATTAAAPKRTKVEQIRRLLELTGSAQLGQQVVDQMFQTFQRSQPNVPGSFWDELRGEMRISDVMDDIVAIYDRKFGQQEIEDVIAFYETPSGRKMVEQLPAITREAMQVGEAWGHRVAERVMRRLRERGFLPKT